MKRILLAFCLSLLTIGFASEPMAQGDVSNHNALPEQIRWFNNYNQALQEAQKTHQPILLFFTGSDWCGWCKKMQQEIFSSPEFIHDVGNQFIFVDVDFPMNKQLPPEIAQQNSQLKQKYGITGYPTLVIIDSNQNFVAQTGYRPGGGKAFADYLKQLLQVP